MEIDVGKEILSANELCMYESGTFFPNDGADY